MSIKKFTIAGLVIVGGAIPFFSTDVSAKSPREMMNELKPLMQTMALDLISIDGIVGDEKEMLNLPTFQCSK